MSLSGDLDRNYAQGGFSGRLDYGRRPALVVVDAAVAYLEPDSPLYAGVEDVIESIKRVLAVARASAVPVYFTEVRFQAGEADGGLFYRKVPALSCFDAGSELGRLADGLEPAAGEVLITKQYPSAFFGTALASSLTVRGVDTLIVTGLTTSGCIRATAVDAMQHGFVPVVVREAVGDRHPGPHEANLFDLQAKYAEVVSEHDVAAWLGALAPREG
jgi:maleamate amidohydrolase